MVRWSTTEERKKARMELRFEQGNFADARIVRTRVFMEEQGFQDEFDATDDDPRTIHVTLYEDDALVGCARIFPDPDHTDEPGRWVFGRLAVLPEARHGGYGWPSPSALRAKPGRRRCTCTRSATSRRFTSARGMSVTAPSNSTSTSSTSG